MGPTKQSDRMDAPHEQVLWAVADAENITPIELRDPLYEAIDPDALDRLLETGTDDVTVTFEYCGYSVTVRGDETVRLESARTGYGSMNTNSPAVGGSSG